MEKKYPKITVITVSYNAETYIEATIKSVISQTYSNLEYIIIDGKSSDRTIDIVTKYKTQIDIIISERDEGIYDAMNKGIELAHGEWIIFMNAGDLFASSTIIDEIFINNYSNSDVLFGNVINKYEWGCTVHIGRNFNGKENRLPFSHQSVFARAEILKENLFDTSFRSAADHDQLYKLYKKGYVFQHVEKNVAIYDVYGLSSSSMQTFKDVARINNITGIKYLFKFFKSWTRIRLKQIVPKSLLNKFLFIKYNMNKRLLK